MFVNWWEFKFKKNVIVAKNKAAKLFKSCVVVGEKVVKLKENVIMVKTKAPKLSECL